MKIIVIEGNTKGEANKELQFKLMADSTILANDKPFFLPDFAPEFKMHAAIAVRIGRLGKNIATRFAHRYYNSVAACAVVTPAGLPADCNALDCRYTAFDGALMLGLWHDKEETETVEAFIDEKEAGTASTANMQNGIDNLVALASQYFTLKMGDMLIVGSDQNAGYTLKIDDHLMATLNGKESLKIRIK